jgi:hypothetical protein
VETDVPSPPLVRSWIAIAAIVAVILAAVLPRLRKPGELDVYLTGARRMMSGQEVYRPTDLKAFTYPPFFALPFVPLAMLPAELQRPAWWLCNLSLLGAAAWLITALAWPVAVPGAMRGGPPIWLNTSLVAVLAMKFVILPLVWESHDLIVLALILASGAATAGRREAASGMWAGLAAACKATPLLLLALFVRQRRWSAAIACALTIVAATALPDLLFPHHDGGWWFERWHSQFVAKVNLGDAPSAPGAWLPWNPLNQSLSGTLHRLFTPAGGQNAEFRAALFPLDKLPLRALTLGLDLAILAWLAWIARPANLALADAGNRSFMCLGQTAAALCAMLLLSPMSSTYHFGALLVPIAFCTTYWMYCERNAVVGAMLAFQLLASLLSAQDLVGKQVADGLLLYGVVTLEAALLLACCGYILAWRLPRAMRAYERPECPQGRPHLLSAWADCAA